MAEVKTNVNESYTIQNLPEYGAENFWTQGDHISHFVVFVLLTMSILSWTQIVIKSWNMVINRRINAAIEKFWNKPTIEEATKDLIVDLGEAHHFSNLAVHAQIAAQHLSQKKGDIGSDLDKSEFITRALRQSINRSNAKMESGLTMLASIGAVAPFVGLFGTVYGIYNALLGVASAGTISLNAVSGPVGEALIMTAAGLFVAIPAVLAYNAFVRSNRLQLMELDGFAHDLHSYFNMGTKAKKGKK
jgi:biopolymer transport protein ExbB